MSFHVPEASRVTDGPIGTRPNEGQYGAFYVPSPRCQAQDFASIPQFVIFLTNYAPAGCWGTQAMYDTWRAHHGLQGLSA